MKPALMARAVSRSSWSQSFPSKPLHFTIKEPQPHSLTAVYADHLALEPQRASFSGVQLRRVIV